MKDQRDRCTMEMGPLLQAAVNGDTVALVYEMYLMPKGLEDKTINDLSHILQEATS